MVGDPTCVCLYVSTQIVLTNKGVKMVGDTSFPTNKGGFVGLNHGDPGSKHLEKP